MKSRFKHCLLISVIYQKCRYDNDGNENGLNEFLLNILMRNFENTL